MPFDEGLAQRIHEQLLPLTEFKEKKMFGGIAFMVRGNMCVGVVKTDLMARVGAEQYTDCLSWHGAREMDFTGRKMTGMIFVDSEFIAEDEQLERWLQACLKFVDTLPSK